MTHPFVAILPQLRTRARHLTRNPADADDLVQDTFVRATTTIDRAEPNRFINYLYRTMWHVFLNSKRRPAGARGKYTYSNNMVSIDAMPGFDIAESSRAEDIFDAEVVLNEIEQLPPRRREVMLRKAEGDEEESIAEQLGISRETVKKQIAQARAQLRERTGDACAVN